MNRHRKRQLVLVRSDVLWERLNRRNMSQNELARRTGISTGYLSQLISGTRSPSPHVRRRLQQVLGVADFDHLFVIESRPDNQPQPPDRDSG